MPPAEAKLCHKTLNICWGPSNQNLSKILAPTTVRQWFSFTFGDGYRISELCKLVSWSKNHPFMIVGEKNFPSHAKLTPGKYISWHAVASLKSYMDFQWCSLGGGGWGANSLHMKSSPIFVRIQYQMASDFVPKKSIILMKIKISKFFVTYFGDFLIEIFSDSLKFSPKLVT